MDKLKELSLKLCYAIEELSASEQQTEISLMASELNGLIKNFTEWEFVEWTEKKEGLALIKGVDLLDNNYEATGHYYCGELLKVEDVESETQQKDSQIKQLEKENERLRGVVEGIGREIIIKRSFYKELKQEAIDEDCPRTANGLNEKLNTFLILERKLNQLNNNGE